MMTVTLTSSQLTAKINSLGAELSSLKNKNDVEFIWQADKNVWARHAPVLFPIVGKLKENKFFYEDTPYSLPQHGFARDTEFELISQDAGACVFRLRSDSETLKKFPFAFIFEIKYELKEKILSTFYTIKNPSPKQMYFSVGAHPGFNCPLLPGENFEDYFLEFESDTYAQTQLEDGLLSNNKTQLKLDDKKLFLSETLFHKDALVFENNQINRISLRSTKSKHNITLDCKDWPFFGIWAKKGNRQFICLEPWYGITDSAGGYQQISGKKGMISLNPLAEFQSSFSVSFS